VTPSTPGRRLRPVENASTPGRVTQVPGFAGYTEFVSATTTAQVTVTLPTVACNTGSDPNFGSVTSSEPVPGVEVGGAEVQIFFHCSTSQYVGWSTLDPNCFGSGCPYEGFIGGVVLPGDQVQMVASESPGGSATSITDLNSGASLSWTTSTSTTSATTAGFGLSDYCFLPGGDGEACSSIDPSSPIPPPGYGTYTPVTFSTAEINGAGLGGTSPTQFNSVWGTTLASETSDVGSGDTYSVTNADLTLPAVSLNAPTVDRPTSGSPSLVFTATLSATSSHPVYLDYATQDGTARAGQDYQAVSGTLLFPPGAVTENIPVPISTGSGSSTADNQLYLLMQLTNPSYVAAGTSGEGIIYEGPVITAVAPSPVPLDGGPSTTITVSGFDLSSVSTLEFCPIASGGGNCLPGTGLAVQSDDALSVTAPDATNDAVNQETTLATDAIATDGAGVSSPVMEPADELVFGCTFAPVTVGEFQVAGCLTDEPDGNDIAQAPSTIDGVDVTATPTDDVTYATGSSSMASTGSITVSLPLAGSAATKIFVGQLSQALSGPVTFAVPAKTTLAGFAISGSLTLSPTSLGQASGTVTVTLPGVLGGGTGKLKFTTTTGGGLSNLTVQVPHANFMKLFALTGVKLVYSAKTSTWEVTGTASTGGTQTTTFAGSLTVGSGGTISAASLQVGSISLAGMVNLSNLAVTDTAGVWSGSGTITQPSSGGTETATVALGFDGSGSLTSGSITASNVTLFGAFEVSTFTMSYASGTWNLSVAATASGSGGSAALTVSGGVITKASLTVSNLSFLGEFTVASAKVSYAAAGTNAACNSVKGSQIWCGSWQVLLPQATTVTGVSGALAFADGQFASGSIDVSGNLPLIDGVFLNSVGLTLTVNPPPTTIQGRATVTFGPTVNSTTLLSVAATLTRTFASGSTSGSYSATGSLSALNQALGTATLTVPDSGKTDFGLTLGPDAATGLSYSKFGVTTKVTGSLSGSFSAGTFTLNGGIMLSINGGTPITGNMKADNHGMAACANSSAGEVGFEYLWSSGKVSTFGSKGCSERGF
jgi:hypothetical protein